MNRLSVIRTLGGCGGTLLARVFGATAGTVVLSETNPRSANLFNGLLNPLQQIRKWHPDLAASVAEFDESEIGYPPRFGQMLRQLHAAAQERGLRLLVRDFSYADFIGVPFIWPPKRDYSLDEAVADSFQIVDILMVRHPADQLASLWAHKMLTHVLTAAHLVEGYEALLSSKPWTTLFQYEKFTAEPEMQLRKMCDALEIPFDPEALKKFGKVKNVTGNLSRAADPRIRAPLPSEAAPIARQQLSACKGYPEVLHRLGYSE